MLQHNHNADYVPNKAKHLFPPSRVWSCCHEVEFWQKSESLVISMQIATSLKRPSTHYLGVGAGVSRREEVKGKFFSSCFLAFLWTCYVFRQTGEEIKQLTQQLLFLWETVRIWGNYFGAWLQCQWGVRSWQNRMIGNQEDLSAFWEPEGIGNGHYLGISNQFCSSLIRFNTTRRPWRNFLTSAGIHWIVMSLYQVVESLAAWGKKFVLTHGAERATTLTRVSGPQLAWVPSTSSSINFHFFCSMLCDRVSRPWESLVYFIMTRYVKVRREAKS